MTGGATRAEKDRVRKEMILTASGMSPEIREEANRRIVEHVLAHPAWKQAKTVMAFVSMPREPDTRPLLEAALKEGKTLLLPRCTDGVTMRGVVTEDLDGMRPGRFGIPEPPEGPDPDPDLILVPCVAATPDGKRLGNGAGYYDRYLQTHEAVKLCLCYRACLKGDLPCGDHDIIMDEVITD